MNPSQRERDRGERGGRGGEGGGRENVFEGRVVG